MTENSMLLQYPIASPFDGSRKRRSKVLNSTPGNNKSPARPRLVKAIMKNVIGKMQNNSMHQAIIKEEDHGVPNLLSPVRSIVGSEKDDIALLSNASMSAFQHPGLLKQAVNRSTALLSMMRRPGNVNLDDLSNEELIEVRDFLEDF